MPAVSSRGRGRRTISEINMVPFIDVMLVLLIIFMVTAPMIAPGLVDLPTIGEAKEQPQQLIEVVITKEEKLELIVDHQTDGRTLMYPQADQLIDQIKVLLQKSPNTSVGIKADKTLKYEFVVEIFDKLKRAGIERVGLLLTVKP